MRLLPVSSSVKPGQALDKNQVSPQERTGRGEEGAGRPFDDLPYVYLSTNHDNISVLLNRKPLKSKTGPG